MIVDEASLAAYQNQIEMARKGPYLDFPAHVHLETNALCNAACNFCPYPSLERKGAKMPDALVTKIIEDLRDVPPTLPFQLSPFKVNEPFLDTRLFSILAQINERLPNATLTLTTNASPITEKQLARLAGVRNLRYLWISMNDHRQTEYEATMKLPYRRTIERMRMVHAALASKRLGLRVVLSRVGDGSAADVAFVQWVTRVSAVRRERLSARRLAQPGRHAHLGSAQGRVRQMVRPVDHGHRRRRALLHGRRGELSNRRRKPPTCIGSLQRAAIPAAARAYPYAPGS